MIRAVEDDDVLRDEATSESTRVFQRGKRGEAGTRGKRSRNTEKVGSTKPLNKIGSLI